MRGPYKGAHGVGAKCFLSRQRSWFFPMCYCWKSQDRRGIGAWLLPRQGTKNSLHPARNGLWIFRLIGLTRRSSYHLPASQPVRPPSDSPTLLVAQLFLHPLDTSSPQEWKQLAMLGWCQPHPICTATAVTETHISSARDASSKLSLLAKGHLFKPKHIPSSFRKV